MAPPSDAFWPLCAQSLWGFSDDKFLYAALEYCSMGCLMDRLQSGGPLRGAELYSVCHDVAMGLARCHSRNVAHCDIKPHNILIDRHGRAKLADFDLSQLVAAGEQSSRFLGSPLFKAPEVIDKIKFDPFAVDICSLGVTLFWIATAKSPFPIGDPGSFTGQFTWG
jgi:serine/threonine protein kinase